MVLNEIYKLDEWIESNGWPGWDPYDIKGKKPVIRLAAKGNENKLYAYLRELVYEFFYHYPLFSRRLFSVEKSINPKAMGLMAAAYTDLYHSTAENKYLMKAESILDWLSENIVRVNGGIGWGYPFDWQSTQFIPAHTPNGIVTTAAGEAFWNYFQLGGEKKYLDTCIEICHFLAALPKSRYGENKICFSYTPLYHNHVHNLNLFVAEFLMKVGLKTGNEEWVKLANSSVNYTLADQAEDGTFDYNGPPENPRNFVDNYHTGFVLRMLHSFWKLSGRKDVFNAMERCYYHYTTHFFEERQIPKLLPDRKYRIDIHSCAEAINCISVLSETYPDQLPLARNVLEWTVKNLQDPEGYFYYGILKSRITGRPFVSKIPYLRWGQAWMLRAMTSYHLHHSSKSVEKGNA
jgi:hypothetical protein